jgi:hypothetical protein
MGDPGTGLSLTIYLLLGVIFSLAAAIVWFIARAARRFDAAYVLAADGGDAAPRA